MTMLSYFNFVSMQFIMFFIIMFVYCNVLGSLRPLSFVPLSPLLLEVLLFFSHFGLIFTFVISTVSTSSSLLPYFLLHFIICNHIPFLHSLFSSVSFFLNSYSFLTFPTPPTSLTFSLPFFSGHSFRK